MAKTLSVPPRNYAAGSYGPFNVDSFTSETTTKLRVTMTVEAWPNVPTVAVVTVLWDNGAGATFGIGGNPLDRDGNPRTSITMEVDVPRGPDALVSSGSASMVVNTAFRTALTVAAI